KLGPNTLSVSISDLPEDSRLECHLDQAPLVPCHDGAVYEVPAAGSHKISAVAIKDDRIVAIGESKTFEVTAKSDTGTSRDEDRLLLVSALPDFTPHATHLKNEAFVAKFAFASKPACEAQLKCAFGQSNTQLWGRCDEGDGSFTV